MSVRTQQAWAEGYRRQVAEYGRLRDDALLSAGVAACLQDGTGVRALRAGGYTLGDLAVLAPVCTPEQPAARCKRAAELESDMRPLSGADVAHLQGWGRLA